jgi:hypothetical protein
LLSPARPVALGSLGILVARTSFSAFVGACAAHLRCSTGCSIWEAPISGHGRGGKAEVLLQDLSLADRSLVAGKQPTSLIGRSLDCP